MKNGCALVLRCLVGFLLATSAALGQADPAVVSPFAAPFMRHAVLRVEVPDQATMDLVLSLTDDVWSHHPVDGRLDVRVTPEQRAQLDAAGVRYEVFVNDVAAIVEAERLSSLRGATFHQSYHTYAEVETFLDDMVATYPQLAQKVNFGTSREGRIQWGLRITGAPTPGFKPAVLYHGGQHAREWITVAMTTYLIDHLLTEYGSDPKGTDLVDRVEWFILPIMNPDGYAYTWTPGGRLWRKNRRINGDGSIGVDLNRNWGGAGWGSDEGSSGEGFSETYRGPSAFSEPETRAVANFIEDHANIRGYCDLHSYSELILWPWGYRPDVTAIEDVYREVGNAMGSRIQAVHGHFYGRGPVYSAIYPVSGGSVDWVYGDQGHLAYSFELRDRGEFGFVLPADRIVPAAEEIVPALMLLTDWVAPLLVIELPDGPPVATPGEALLAFAVDVRDSGEIVAPGSPRLRYRMAGGGPFTTIPLTHLEGTTYEAELPIGCAARVEYYLQATTTTGAVVEFPRGAPGRWLSVENPQPIAVESTGGDVWRCLGESFQLTATVSGVGELFYQWRHDGVDIPGAIRATFDIEAVSASDLGTYQLMVTDTCENVAFSQSTRLLEAEITVLQEPLDRVFCVGMSPAFTQIAEPAAALSYQWYFNGAPLDGETGHKLQLIDIDYEDAGEYHCVVRNQCLEFVGESATLTIPFVEVSRQPLDRCAVSGDDVVFTVEGDGEDLRVQWQKDRRNIPGATSPTLLVHAVTAADVGAYRAVVYTPELCIDVSTEAMLLVDTCTTCGTPIPGDLDGDGDRDLADYAIFQTCFEPESATPLDCACADINGDGVIDLADFSLVGHEIEGP